MKLKLLLAVLLCAVTAPILSAQTQPFAYYNNALAPTGTLANSPVRMVTNATIRVCLEPASGTPCTPLATIYSDPGLSVPLANPFQADFYGNYVFYVPAGTYHVQQSGPQVAVTDIPYIVFGAGGGGGGNITFEHNGVTVGVEPKYNMVDTGTAVFTVTDDPSNQRVNAQIAASGGGGGLPAGVLYDIQINDPLNSFGSDTGVGQINPTTHTITELIASLGQQVNVSDTTHNGQICQGHTTGSAIDSAFCTQPSATFSPTPSGGYGLFPPDNAPAAIGDVATVSSITPTVISTLYGNIPFYPQHFLPATGVGICGGLGSNPGDICYFNGAAWVIFTGNASGTKNLQETSAGVPQWASAVPGLVSAENVTPTLASNSPSPMTTNDIIYTPYTQAQNVSWRGLPPNANGLAYIASAPPCQDSTGTLSAAACPLSSTTATDTILVTTTSDLNATTSVTDSQGNTYTALANVGNQGFFYAKNIKGGNDTVTVHYAGNTGFMVQVAEVIGADPVTPIAQDGGGTSGCAGQVPNFNSVTLAAPGTVIGLISAEGVAHGGFSTYIPTGGYFLPNQLANDGGGGLGASRSVAMVWHAFTSTGAKTPAALANANCTTTTYTIAIATNAATVGQPTWRLDQFSDWYNAMPYGTDFGAADAYVTGFASCPSSLIPGISYTSFIPAHANATTTPTLNWCGLGANTITKNGQSALAASDLITTKIAQLVWDGVDWELQNPATGGTGNSTTVNGQTCTLGSSCSVESATAGQVAISAGASAALTGWADLTVSSHTGTMGSSGILDLSAASLFKIPVSAGATSSADGVIAYDSTGKNTHVRANGADAVAGAFTTAPVSGDCITATVSAGNILLGDAGSPCGSASGFVTASGSPVAGNIAKFTTATNIAPASATNIVNLFSGCSGTQYLGADGACHNASSGPGGGLVGGFMGTYIGGSATNSYNNPFYSVSVTYGMISTFDGYFSNLGVYVTTPTNGQPGILSFVGTSGVTLTSGVTQTYVDQYRVGVTGSAAGVYHEPSGMTPFHVTPGAGFMLYDNGPASSSAPFWGASWEVLGSTSQPLGALQVSNTQVSLSSTAYVGFSVKDQLETSTEARVGMVVPFAATAKNLCVKLSTGQPASGTLVVTLRDNAADTAVTFTVPISGGTGVYCDNTDTAAIAAGDYIDVKFVNNATGSSANFINTAVELIPTAPATAMVFWSQKNQTYSTGGVQWIPAFVSVAAVSTEAQARAPMPRAGVIKNCYTLYTTPPGTNSLALTVVKNGSNSTLVMTAPTTGSGAQIVNDLTHTVSFAQWDSFDLNLSQSSGTNAVISSISCEVD